MYVYELSVCICISNALIKYIILRDVNFCWNHAQIRKKHITFDILVYGFVELLLLIYFFFLCFLHFWYTYLCRILNDSRFIVEQYFFFLSSYICPHVFFCTAQDKMTKIFNDYFLLMYLSRVWIIKINLIGIEINEFVRFLPDLRLYAKITKNVLPVWWAICTEGKQKYFKKKNLQTFT